MLSASASDFRKEMKKYLDLVIEDFETLVINRGMDQAAVMISLKEYNSLMETMHLLSTQANREHLDTSMQEFKEGKTVEFELPEDEDQI